MERQKSILGRKKARGPTAPGDFIALGKQAKPQDGDTKRPISPTSLARKKDVSGLSSSASAAKKAKLGGSGFAGRAHGDAAGPSYGGGSQAQHDEIAITVEPAEFLYSIISADDEHNDERAEALMCGAAKMLRGSRVKPDSVLYVSLMHLAKSRPNLFCSEFVLEAFCSLLKREMALSFKAKGNPLVSVLSCNLLMGAFADEENWPDSFVKVFVEDSLGERVWVDREDCRTFVDNIMTAFGTKRSPKHLLMATAEAMRGEAPGSPNPTHMSIDDDENSKTSDSGDVDRMSSGSGPSACVPRFPFQKTVIESYIIDTTRDILNRRQSMDSSSRNLIKLMTSTSGYSEIRSMAAQRIDMWLQNPKLTRVSQDLLLALCTNCDKHDQSDLEVIGQLTKMRMKTKPLINHFLNCIRELLSQHPENLRMILSYTIYNELSTARNPNNMALITTVFSHSPEQAAKILAELFQDLLSNKDDYLKALRVLLREIVRCTRLDMNFATFCRALMQERTETKFVNMEPALKERYVMCVADLISMDILLSISPSVREAASGFMQGDHKNIEVVHNFKRQVSVIQRDAVWWMHMVVPKLAELKADGFLHCLKKVLFMESAEHYYNKDNWPPESERGLLLRLASESPVLEDTLTRLLVVGLMPELPLGPPDAVELLDQLVCRAANLRINLGMADVLQMEQLNFIDALLKLCVYKHPDSIQLPAGYTPPNLAISGLMWKAWLTLLVITAYNPTVYGETAWQKFPGLQSMMEMIMTNNFTFPPPTSVTDDKMAEEYKATERQIRQQEIQLILEFEGHLAAATSKVTITESNSLLIGQLNLNDPYGAARFPPQEVLEQLRALNASLGLGQMLCRSRNPDFLLHVINRQGTSKSMPWLAELVESSEGSLDVLPVQCLCEFLLHEPSDLATDADVEDVFGADRSKRKQKNRKHAQLVARLQEVVHSSDTESSTMREVLDYFLQRLASIQAATRQQAVKGLSLVVSAERTPDGDESMDVDFGAPASDEWLLQHIPALPLFHDISQALAAALLQACQVETDPERISSYIVYLSEHALDKPQPPMNELTLGMSQLLVDRPAVISHILSDTNQLARLHKRTHRALLKVFVAYTRTARREASADTFSWSNAQDQIRLEWEGGQSATMHFQVIRAAVVLLTYARPSDNEEGASLYDELFNLWLQENGCMPSGYLVDTSEEALLLPDWLKMRMLRAADNRVVDAAMHEVEPAQLVPFVQWFGVPVPSMSRLLAALDQAVTSDPEAIFQVVNDTTYMLSLLDIQHGRGATGGHVFKQALLQPGGGSETEGADGDKGEGDAQEEMSTEDSWSMQGSGEAMLPNSVDKMARILDQVFTNTGSSEKTAASLFQSVLQAVSTDKTKAAVVIKAFDNLLSSSKREAFAQKVYATTHRSCPILKLMIAKQTDLHSELTPVVEKLHGLASGQRSMLTSMMTQFLVTRGRQPKQTGKGTQPSAPSSVKSSSKQVDALVSKCCSAKKGFEPDAFMQGLSKLPDPEQVELAVQRVMESLLRAGKASDGTRLACQALDPSTSNLPEGSSPLFVDWLSVLDPEIVNANPELEHKLLFARQEPTRSSTDSSSVWKQAEVRAALTHQASWSTLSDCLGRLLKPGTAEQLDPTSVLDFVWACEHIPSIWRGREKNTQKIEYKEDVLGLSAEQLTVVLDLVLEEMAVVASRHKANKAETSSPQASVSLRNCRRELLLHCVAGDVARVIALVDHLQGLHADTDLLKLACIECVGASLYLQFPYIQAWLPLHSSLLSRVPHSTDVQSQMDVISHRLITALAMTGPGAKAQDRMHDANIACRKMAAHHPNIFLRQIPLLGSVLCGQSQFTIGEMRHSGRLQLFTHALGLAQLLQPQLFEVQHREGLHSLLDAFFLFMKNHGEEKSLGAHVTKLIAILQNYLSHSPHAALPLLNKQLQMLNTLTLVFPNLPEVKALITSIALPSHSTDPATDTTSTGTVGESSGGSSRSRSGAFNSDLLTPASSTFTPVQLARFKRRFMSNSSQDLLTVLKDLDEVSKRRIEILPHFENELKYMMTTLNDQCRNSAFHLIIRHLKHDPRRAEEFVSTFLDCLGSEEPGVVTSALKNLADFTTLCQEEAIPLLERAFEVGIKMSLDSSTYISEAFHTLNLHSSLQTAKV